MHWLPNSSQCIDEEKERPVETLQILFEEFRNCSINMLIRSMKLFTQNYEESVEVPKSALLTFPSNCSMSNTAVTVDMSLTRMTTLATQSRLCFSSQHALHMLVYTLAVHNLSEL